MSETQNFNDFDQFLDSLDPEVGNGVQEIQKKTSISSELQLLRMEKGLSQKEVAQRMGCTQSNVSKIENKFDDDLTLGELKRYLQSIEVAMGISIGPELTLAESINKNIKELEGDLEKLKCIKDNEDSQLSKAIDDYLATSHRKLLEIVLTGMSGMEDQPNKTEMHINVGMTHSNEKKPQAKLAHSQ